MNLVYKNLITTYITYYENKCIISYKLVIHEKYNMSLFFKYMYLYFIYIIFKNQP